MTYLAKVTVSDTINLIACASCGAPIALTEDRERYLRGD